MIKLIFKTNNNKDIVDLDSILLSKHNPRYTIVNILKDDLMKLIIDNVSEKNQQEIFEELFYSEGDLNDLKRLLDNIFENGFDNSSEPLFLVYNEKINKYVVAEGNRRTMCLKLIFNDTFKIPKYETFIQNNFLYSNENSEKIDENIEIKNNVSQKTYKEIIELIDKFKEKCLEDNFHINWTINCSIVLDNKSLWKDIFDKHLTGERPGMRKWSRAKYFSDLLLTFPNGINEEISDIKLVFSKILREKDCVKKDFKEAQFVYYSYLFGNYYDDKLNNDGIFNLEILEAIKKSRNISALETNHSFNKVREIICEDILDISISDFSNEYFSIYYDEKCCIRFNDKRIEKSKLLSFIYKNWKKKIITTRPIKKEHFKHFVNDLKIILDDINFNEKITKEKIDELNPFEMSKENLEKLILTQKKFYKSHELLRFEKALEINENNKKIIENINAFSINRNEPISVFWILKNQLFHNSENKVYLNAIFSTIRSFFEQLLIWMQYSYLGEEEENESEKIELLKSISKGEMHKVLSQIRKIKNKDPALFELIIGKSLNYGLNNKNINEIIKQIKDLFNDDIWYGIINENIHASHRIYMKSIYNEKLSFYQNFQKLVILIIDELDFSRFEKLNSDIVEYIKSENNN